MASLFAIVDQFLAGLSREARNNISGEQISATLSRGLISPLTNQIVLEVEEDGSLVSTVSGATLVSAEGLLVPAAGSTSSALLDAVLAVIGGVFQIANSSTGTVFPVGIAGPDNAPSLDVFLPGSAVLGAFVFPPSSSGQAVLRSNTTGTVFPVVLDGPDVSADFAILAPGSAIPPTTYQLDGNGNLALWNRTTGNFLPVTIAGTDAAPALAILAAA